MLILCGELLTILAELGAIKIEQLGWPWQVTIILMAFVYFISGCCLLPAYSLSERVFRSTWTTAVLTIGCVLLLEPITILLLFSESPNLSSLAGFAFGILGLSFCLFESEDVQGKSHAL